MLTRSPARSLPSRSPSFGTTPCSTPRAASRIAFAIATRDELPCAMTTRPRNPSRYAPPCASGSRRARSRRAAGLISSPPSLPRGVRSISARNPSNTERIVPSSSFSETLPVKPSVTTTSAAPSSSQRLSTLPAKLQVARGEQAVRLLRRLVSLPGLLADREQADLGPRDLEDLLREDRPHRRELEQVLRLRFRVRARVDQHRRPAHGRDDDGDRRPHHPRQPPDLEQRRRQHRARVPRRDDGGRVTAAHRPARSHERAVRLAANGLRRLLVHLDDLASSRRARAPPGRSTTGRRAPAEQPPSARRARPRRSRPGARSPPSASTATRMGGMSARESARGEARPHAHGTSCTWGTCGETPWAGRRQGRRRGEEPRSCAARDACRAATSTSFSSGQP